MVFHIAAERCGEYVLDHWSEPALESWQSRHDAPVEALEGFDVGDVVEQVAGNRRNLADGSFERADPDVADAVRAAYAPVLSTVEECVAEYGLDGADPVRSFDDGDVVLMVTPQGEGGHGVEDVAYVTPPGLKSAGYWRARNFAALVNVDTSTLESGMAFDVTELDEYVCALEYDAEATDAVRRDPVQVEVMCPFERLTEVHDFLDAWSDFEPPFYVLVDGFDDGQFYSTLYDSGGDGEVGEDGMAAVRELCGASAYPAQTIPRDWPYSGRRELIPVHELHLSENEYADWPVAVLERDVDLVRP